MTCLEELWLSQLCQTLSKHHQGLNILSSSLMRFKLLLLMMLKLKNLLFLLDLDLLNLSRNHLKIFNLFQLESCQEMTPQLMEVKSLLMDEIDTNLKIF